MDALLISAGVVALAEIGDKTQLLALVLAARFRRPLRILLGVFVASLVNHGLAALAGTWVGDFLSAERLTYVIGLSFLGVAVWALWPERLWVGETEGPRAMRYGALVSTMLSMFLAEMGDRTQIATLALAARFETWLPVVLGTSAGMVLANLPVVMLGGMAAGRLPLRLIRVAAAGAFAAIGLWMLYVALAQP